MSENEKSVHQDEGINEVMQMTNSLTIKDEDAGGQKDQNLSDENHFRTDMTDANSSAGACGSQKSSSSEGVDIDFADPERVLQMLETVDLSEEDTELLLQEAYKMNRQLKEILKHQETTSCPPDIQRQKSRTRMNRDKMSSGSYSHSGSRSESGTFSAARPLPPIQATDLYTMKLKRSNTNIPVVNRHSTASVERSKTAKMPSRNDSRASQTKKKPKAPEDRPEWNNRFNFT